MRSTSSDIPRPEAYLRRVQSDTYEDDTTFNADVRRQADLEACCPVGTKRRPPFLISARRLTAKVLSQCSSLMTRSITPPFVPSPKSTQPYPPASIWKDGVLSSLNGDLMRPLRVKLTSLP